MNVMAGLVAVGVYFGLREYDRRRGLLDDWGLTILRFIIATASSMLVR